MTRLQQFPGERHQISFLFRPATDTADRLAVVFSDVAPVPNIEWLAELEPAGCHQLYISDDFGPYVDEHGYPGCWYLGEDRSLSFTEDVERLVDHALSTHELGPESVIAIGTGKGGFAALWFALRNGWGEVLVGAPHVRLGHELHDTLTEVARFIAGGTGVEQRAALDRLLYDLVATSHSIPDVDVLVGRRDPAYAEHVLPLTEILASRGKRPEVTVRELGEDPSQRKAMFGAYLMSRLLRRMHGETLVVPTGSPDELVSRWSSRTSPEVVLTEAGARCFAPLVPVSSAGGLYAGLRFPVEPFGALRVEFTLRRPHEIEALFLDATDESGTRLGRWQWNVDLSWAPASERTSVVLQAGRSTPPFRFRPEKDLAATASVDFFVRVRGGGIVDLTVHELGVTRGQPIRKPGLPIPPVGASERRRRDRMGQLEVTRELVHQQQFPPAFELPRVVPSRPWLKVACLLGPLSRLGFGYEFDCVEITTDGYKQVINRERPAMLLVDSGWSGQLGSADNLLLGTTGAGPTEPVRKLIAHCRRRNIPTVFWDKEGTANFELLVSTATLFDYIFTSDESSVERYRDVAEHERVGVLPFAAQPRIHNPIGSTNPRQHELASLGAATDRERSDCRRQVEMVIDPAREFGVHLYSRADPGGTCGCPGKYLPHYVGTVPYERVLGAYRSYKVMLNVNSEVGSRTACPQRIFEILACGGAVLSGPSAAITSMIGGGIVEQTSGPGNTREILRAILDDDDRRERRSVVARRAVLRAHTYGHRVDQMLVAVGLGEVDAPAPTVVVAQITDRSGLERLLDALQAQDARRLELLVVGGGGGVDDETVAAAAVRAGLEGGRLVIKQRELRPALAAADRVVFLGPETVPEPHLITDLLDTASYAAADVVGAPQDAAAAYLPDAELDPSALLASRRALDIGVPRSLDETGLQSWQQRMRRTRRVCIAADPYRGAD